MGKLSAKAREASNALKVKTGVEKILLKVTAFRDKESGTVTEQDDADLFNVKMYLKRILKRYEEQHDKIN